MRLLIVEDERSLADAVSQILKKENYTVDTVYDGEQGLDFILSDIYDVILLDIMMPKKDGLSVLKEARLEGIKTPVILLTAKGEISDRVAGLDSGADDYLPKPFATEELLARIRAISRRKGEVTVDNTMDYGDINLNPTALILKKGEKEIKLTLKESELLEYFMNRKGLIASKEMIIEKLWGYDSDAEHNNVEVYISFLRKKLGFLQSNVSIVTTRGIGYSLEVKEDV